MPPDVSRFRRHLPPLYYATFVHVLGRQGDTVFSRPVSRISRASYIEPTGKLVVSETATTITARESRYWFGAPGTIRVRERRAGCAAWTGWTVAFGFGWAWGDAVLANGPGGGMYPWWQRANARVVEAATNRPVGISYNSRTAIASAGQRGAIEDLRASTGIVQAREVAVTPTSAIVPPAGAFFRFGIAIAWNTSAARNGRKSLKSRARGAR